MCEVLNRWIWPPPNSNYEDWLHPASVTRTRAIQMLSDYGSDDGTFLIRKSSKKSNCLVISMCCDKTFFHFEIEKRGIYYFLGMNKLKSITLMLFLGFISFYVSNVVKNKFN